MVYSEETELKRQIRRADLRMKTVSAKLGWPPSTLSAKLNGYAPLAYGERKQIEEIIRQAEGREAEKVAAA